MTTLELAAGQWITFIVIWGVWQLLPHARTGGPGTMGHSLGGVRGLRYVMSLAIGFIVADVLGAATLHKPLTLIDLAGLGGLGLGAVAVMLGATRIDHNRPGPGGAEL